MARTRGIALITTMMVMALLLTLIGAFISVEKSSNRLTGNALERRGAQDACLTALNLAWNYLEDDPSWGTTANFSVLAPRDFPAAKPVVRIEQKLVGNDKILAGILHAEGNFTAPEAVSFEMRIYNNLRGRLATTFQGTLPVPAHSCRMICLAKSGSSTRRMDTILRQVPISYDSLVAGRDAEVQTTPGGLTRLESRDPWLNRVSAGDDLSLPAATNVQFLRTGTANSGNLRLNGVPQTTENQLNSAGDASNGIYNIGQGPPTIPQFNSENFMLPDDPTKVTSVASGDYQFGGLERVRYLPQTIQWQEPPPPPPPGGGPSGPGDSGSCQRYQRETSTYDQLIDAEGRIWVAAQAREGSVILDPPSVPTSPLGSEGAAQNWGYDQGTEGFPGGVEPPESDVHEIYPGLFANVVTAQMAIKPGYRMDCNGAFRVTADGDRLPEMLFGYAFSPGGVAVQESLNDGLEAALAAPQNYMSAVVAGGDIDIPGGVIGYGSMIAGGDMTLKASSGLRTAPQLGVVVKARRLTVNPATEAEPQLPGEPVSTDYPIFQEAITSFAGGDWTQFDNWLTETAAARLTTTQTLKATTLTLNASTVWSQLNTELGTSFPLPTLPPGWGGSLTLEQYIRLKEFAQTLASGYNHGQGDATWLDMTQHSVDAEARLSNTVSTMAQWAKSYKKTLQDYLASPNPEVPDMFYQGLVYADEDLTINANGKSFRLEGSAVAGRNASVLGARSVDLVYDRALVDDQMRTNHAVNGNTSHLRLEKIFFTMN